MLPGSSLMHREHLRWVHRFRARDGAVADAASMMQTRAELYELIDVGGYEALDATIVASRRPAIK